MIIVDTPGLHKPKTLLGERLNAVVRETLTEVDAVGFCVPADQPVGPGDKFLAAELSRLKSPVLALVTKSDTVEKDQLGAQLLAVSGLGDWAEIVPVSAVTGWQVDLVADLFVARLPEGAQSLSRGRAHRRARADTRGRVDPRGHPGGRPR